MTQFSPPSHDPQAPVWELSGWWRRVGASIIDSLIISVPIFILYAALGLGLLPRVLLPLVIGAVYYCWIMTSTNGQTIGKMATEIRVVREDGSPVDASFAFVREILVISLLFNDLALILLGIPTLLNYLWPLWDDGNQALHDKIVKSRVVRAKQVSRQSQASYDQSPYAGRPIPAVPPDPFAPQPPAAPPAPGAAPPPPPPAPGTPPPPPAPAAPGSPPPAPGPPPPPAPPGTSQPYAPPPPPPPGPSQPYTPPPGFQNPVPDEEDK